MTLRSTLVLGSFVVTIFAVIFLFYTSSFLSKRRRKEFGLLNVLGMEKKHIARMMFGSDNTRLVPASLSLGAVFMALVDTLARSATASEIPISILTAVIGAPFFIQLLRQSRGWNS